MIWDGESSDVPFLCQDYVTPSLAGNSPTKFLESADDLSRPQNRYRGH